MARDTGHRLFNKYSQHGRMRLHCVKLDQLLTVLKSPNKGLVDHLKGTTAVYTLQDNPRCCPE